MTESTAAASLRLPVIEQKAAASKRRLPVLPVAALLQAQQTLTAVERFAKEHEQGSVDGHAKYRDLIPLERPREGEQYAFEVDLDACTGCKACVAACHTLNGLDDGEMWRSVGLLHGGTPAAAVVQTVTTSCHHCAEPACLLGCPVKAYEKDPVTGIVKHLDDQCFGCEYCTLMCPYDAPKYSKSRGIVRKCDMCSDRLAHGEAPACVQACPNAAITIQVVSRAGVVERANAQSFLPGAPAPDHTLPSTVYKTAKVLPNNLLPANFYRTSPEHSHPPLVLMLTLTQLSVGAFAVGWAVERLSGQAAGSSLAQAAFAVVVALVALGASVLHLGRPWLAWRAILGLRTSWLSREAVAFGAFAGLALLYGGVVAGRLPMDPASPTAMLVQDGAAFMGLLGVLCSVMVYVATRREQWSGVQTGLKFFGSTLILGAATVLTVSAFTSPEAVVFDRVSRALLWLVLVVTSLKISFEAGMLRHFRDPRQTAHKRMALVMLNDLRGATVLRFGLAMLGGIVIPLLLRALDLPRAMAPATALMLALTLCGELAERYLFFRAAPASRMPGGIR